jgi:hypothetical protein
VAGHCPLFCQRVGESCLRPVLTSVPESCGTFEGFLRGTGSLADPTVPCPATCCAAVSTGDDKDADGIVGSADLCPDAPEDVDGFDDFDGCPDTDNDGDGWDDVKDMCCFVAEDKDGVQDEDGCPEP